ncbi:MAG: hypothetical protein HDS62_03225 [Bacteroidales bacterium]|nr:hypothetical protein [Bacteroidales bacterium]
MDEKKPYWWITMKVNGHFNTLFVKEQPATKEEIDSENWQNCIFFETKEEAEEFIKKMKAFIEEEYPRAKSQKWYVSKKS